MHLENQLCFLLYASSREVTKQYKPLLEKLNITYPQYLVLLLLWQYKKMPVKQIGLYLHLDTGTLTPMLKRMEQQDIVRRIRSIEDERTVNVVLTEKGEQLQQEASDIPIKIIDKFGMEIEQIEQLRNQLELLLDRLNHQK
ncbi:organic hydroperoxide resistance transcriptional regulator [Virgibacillus kapii]|nr:organic hydroperoxide resistance transcriptional regulator [Virgibacillus kapii]